ncbi:MAG: DUF4389 domain-containing protein [Candidatus Thioglobus sp.]|nr:DUF4389 domain-containing protein [Candidatus Thioglobus sp.]|tara:strand:+ start:37 stop:399 length:363 start_codon:yes stop_codon:yes gene_type:complete
MEHIDKDEILKTSKWIRFIFMLGYAFAINFALSISIGLSFIQFLFFLFTSKTNESIGNFNAYIIEFFHDTLAFLLFETDDKPFPFKPNHSDEVVEEEEGEIVEAEIDLVEDLVTEEDTKE